MKQLTTECTVNQVLGLQRVQFSSPKPRQTYTLSDVGVVGRSVTTAKSDVSLRPSDFTTNIVIIVIR